MGASARFEWILAAVGFVVASTSAAHRASAQERAPFTLDWRAPAECPAQAELVARVEQLRGEHATTPNANALDVRTFVTLSADGRFRAELRMVQSDGERVRILEAPTCTGVAEASAVVIALALSPNAESAEADVTPAPAVAPARPAASREAAEGPASPAADTGRTPPASASDEQIGFHFDASAGVATDFGATAAVALGATALGRLRYGERVSFALRGSFFPARDSTVPGLPSQGVSILLAAAAPLVCLSPFDLTLEVAACAEFELGYLHAQGFGPALHPERAIAWLAPGAGLSAAFPKRGLLRSRLSADALFPTSRTEFVLTNIGQAHETGVAHRLPLVAPRVALYLELAFP